MTTKIEINKNLQAFINPTNDPIEILEDILEDSSYEDSYVRVTIQDDLAYYRYKGYLEDLEWYGSNDIVVYVYHSDFIGYEVLEREIYAMTDEDRLKYLKVRSCLSESAFKTKGEIRASRLKWKAMEDKAISKELAKRKKENIYYETAETLAGVLEIPCQSDKIISRIDRWKKNTILTLTKYSENLEKVKD